MAIFGPIGGNPCSEASCDVVTFSLVSRHCRWFWGLGTPNPPFVLFGPENGIFKPQNTAF